MSAHVLVTGVMYRQAEQRTSKTGKAFVTATLRCKSEAAASEWWKVVCFSESACAELLRLSDGDSLSAQGALKLDTYEKDGSTFINRTVIADAVLALRAPPRERKRPEEAPRRPAQAAGRRSSHGMGYHGTDAPAPDLNDDLPF